jgi:hypothetical protein
MVDQLKKARAAIHASKSYHMLAHQGHGVCYLTYFALIAAHESYAEIAIVLLVLGMFRLVIEGEA